MAGETDDVDVGLLQVNLKRHGHHFGDPATLLDARINLVVAAGILADAIDSARGDLTLGIGRYRHPHDNRAARAYGRRIQSLRDALRQSPAKPVPRDVLDLWRTSAVLDLVAGPESRGNYNAWYREAHQSEVQLADGRRGARPSEAARAPKRRLRRRPLSDHRRRFQLNLSYLLIAQRMIAQDEHRTENLLGVKEPLTSWLQKASASAIAALASSPGAIHEMRLPKKAAATVLAACNNMRWLGPIHVTMTAVEATRGRSG